MSSATHINCFPSLPKISKKKMLVNFESKSARVKGLSFHSKRPWILARYDIIFQISNAHQFVLNPINCRNLVTVCIVASFNCGIIACALCLRNSMSTMVPFVAFAFTISSHCLSRAATISKSRYEKLISFDSHGMEMNESKSN